MSDFVRQNSCECSFATSDSWVILSPIEQSIKRKIEAVGVPLKDWDISINYGIKTGFNDAFIITSEKRQEILDNCKTEDERKRTDELIRPILRGRDIKRYSYEPVSKVATRDKPIGKQTKNRKHNDRKQNNIIDALGRTQAEFVRQNPVLYVCIAPFDRGSDFVPLFFCRVEFRFLSVPPPFEIDNRNVAHLFAEIPYCRGIIPLVHFAVAESNP